MSAATNKGVPGVPLAALDAIQDENTRQVLRAIVDGWNVRNGSSGDGKSRFVTAAELGTLSGQVGGLKQSLEQQAANPSPSLTATQIGRIITDLQASVMESVLFKELGDRIRLIDITATGVATGLSTEITNRTNADNAIVQSTTTQFAAVNGNISALQTQQTTTANNVSALSSYVTTLQSEVGANTAAIQTEATTRINADNDIYAKYSVKIDVNGYVSGFGLISTANNSTPYSEFIVRADRFAIGSPSGPGITPQVPFVVLTTTDSHGNGPGVYVDNAIIKNASVGTLKVDGNAITVTSYASNTTGSFSITESWTTITTTYVTVSGLAAGETAGTIISGYTTIYENGGSAATVVTGIFVEGVEYSRSGCTVGESKTNSLMTFANAPNGTYMVQIKVRTDPASGGATTKPVNNIIGGITVMSGKR